MWQLEYCLLRKALPEMRCWEEKNIGIDLVSLP